MEENSSENFAKSLGELSSSLNKFSQLMMDRCDQLEKKIATFAPTSTEHNNSDHNEVFQIRDLTREDLGPLYPLLKDPSISDILVNDPQSVYIERAGKLEKTGVTFDSNEQLLEIAKKIAAAAGRKFDMDRPYLDTRLIDGSRLNIVAPPLSIDGISMSIRKFPNAMITLDNLTEYGSMDEKICEFLKVCARSRINILVIGGTGSGKTTMLNSIAQYISQGERIVTIEDAAELRLPIEHKVRLESKQKFPGAPDHHEVTIRDLMMNALRMRPDRIIVGETRGGEAFDMIQAMNTGHEGSMTTIHANSPRDGMMRLENMITVAVPTMSSLSIKQRIASAIELVVMVARMDDGSRKVTYVTEIIGMEGEVVSMQDLFTYNQTGVDESGKILGEFKRANIMPKLAKKCMKYCFRDQLNQIFNIAGVAAGAIQQPRSGFGSAPRT